ncbi:MAG: NAD(+)/NADH kinase [Endomicrobiales bacterium]|nr:NAD(+)/NADH kinase [Endomicrobiales bacterium]
MKKVGIIFNPEKPKARKELTKLSGWLKRKKCSVISMPSSNKKISSLDFALTLGGDGTMLKASRMLASARIPVLGINLGSLGFLAETNPKEVYTLLQDILNDRYRVEERMMLSVTIKSNKKLTKNYALNDVIIHSGKDNRVVTVTAEINDEFVADYIGDGIIVATPTGSTAYSLAANGPIVHPVLSVFILTPICPHTLTQRPLIVPSQSRLTLNLDSKIKESKPVLSIDGQINHILNKGDLIKISASNESLRLIVNPRRKYLKVLRTKLKWGERG